MMMQQQVLEEYESVFPKTQEMLEKKHYALALRVVGYYKNFDIYENDVDFLVGECFPHWKKKILAYYEDNGPKLTEFPYWTREKIEEVDNFFCELLKAAYERAYNRESLSWSEFMKECKQL